MHMAGHKINISKLQSRIIFVLFFFLLVTTQDRAADAAGRWQSPGIVAFVKVNVIPMESERMLAKQTVLVRGDRIVRIGPADDVAVPVEALVVDGNGAFLMPGLADMHVHLGHDIDPTHLWLYLDAGVTTVRNLSGMPEHLDLKKSIARGEIPGPNLYTSGPTIMGVSKEHDDRRRLFRNGGVPGPKIVDEPCPIFEVAETPAEARDLVKAQIGQAYDSLKTYDFLSAETYDAAMAVGRKYGRYIVGHAPDAVPLQKVLTSGMDELAHINEYLVYFWVGYGPQADNDEFMAYEIDYGKIPEAVALTRRNNVAVSTTLVVEEWMYRRDAHFQDLSWEEHPPVEGEAFGRTKDKGGRPPIARTDESNCHRNAIRPFLLKLTKALHDAGVLLVAGTDTSMEEGIPGHSLLRELEILVQAGLSPFQALSTATRNAAQVAEAMNGDGDWGRIAPGLRADLLLLDANPLEDIRNIYHRQGVMVRGRWYSGDALERGIAQQPVVTGDHP